jgi:hypothetical protein
MDITLQKLGSSAEIPALSRSLPLVNPGQLAFPTKHRVNLSVMLSACDLSAVAPSDLALWDRARPAGREVW